MRACMHWQAIEEGRWMGGRVASFYVRWSCGEKRNLLARARYGYYHRLKGACSRWRGLYNSLLSICFSLIDRCVCVCAGKGNNSHFLMERNTTRYSLIPYGKAEVLTYTFFVQILSCTQFIASLYPYIQRWRLLPLAANNPFSSCPFLCQPAMSCSDWIEASALI